MKQTLLAMLLGLFAFSAMAQFTGPSLSGSPGTVQQAHQARFGTYVTVVGHIVAHQREDYYTFRDATGEIRVEIEPEIWRNRRIGPETKVSLFAEVDLGLEGRYLWVESLQVLN